MSKKAAPANASASASASAAAPAPAVAAPMENLISKEAKVLLDRLPLPHLVPPTGEVQVFEALDTKSALAKPLPLTIMYGVNKYDYAEPAIGTHRLMGRPLSIYMSVWAGAKRELKLSPPPFIRQQNSPPKPFLLFGAKPTNEKVDNSNVPKFGYHDELLTTPPAHLGKTEQAAVQLLLSLTLRELINNVQIYVRDTTVLGTPITDQAIVFVFNLLMKSEKADHVVPVRIVTTPKRMRVYFQMHLSARARVDPVQFNAQAVLKHFTPADKTESLGYIENARATLRVTGPTGKPVPKAAAAPSDAFDLLDLKIILLSLLVKEALKTKDQSVFDVSEGELCVLFPSIEDKKGVTQYEGGFKQPMPKDDELGWPVFVRDYGCFKIHEAIARPAHARGLFTAGDDYLAFAKHVLQKQPIQIIKEVSHHWELAALSVDTAPRGTIAQLRAVLMFSQMLYAFYQLTGTVSDTAHEYAKKSGFDQDLEVALDRLHGGPVFPRRNGVPLAIVEASKAAEDAAADVAAVAAIGAAYEQGNRFGKRLEAEYLAAVAEQNEVPSGQPERKVPIGAHNSQSSAASAPMDTDSPTPAPAPAPVPIPAPAPVAAAAVVVGPVTGDDADASKRKEQKENGNVDDDDVVMVEHPQTQAKPAEKRKLEQDNHHESVDAKQTTPAKRPRGAAAPAPAPVFDPNYPAHGGGMPSPVPIRHDRIKNARDRFKTFRSLLAELQKDISGQLEGLAAYLTDLEEFVADV